MKNNTQNITYYIKIAVFMAVLIGLDQFTKYLAVLFLKNRDAVSLIPGVLELRYLENSGAAFGMLQNQQWIFAILTVVFLIAAIAVFRKTPKTGRYIPLILTVSVLVSGAIGNFIDRLAHRYVVDFIYFSIIDFPIFNVADIYVTLSVIALLILIFFHYKEEDFQFLRKKKKENAGEQ